MPNHSSPQVLEIKIPLPISLVRDYLDSGGNITLTATPGMLRAAMGEDPREQFTPLDKLIAQVVDDHGPVQAGEVVRLLDEEHDRLTSEGVVRDRFGNKNPLKKAGYTRLKGEGYISPANGVSP